METMKFIHHKEINEISPEMETTQLTGEIAKPMMIQDTKGECVQNDNFYEKHLTKLMLPESKPLRSIDMPLLGDPRRIKRAQEERKRGIYFPTWWQQSVASPLINMPIGSVINCEQHKVTFDIELAKKCNTKEVQTCETTSLENGVQIMGKNNENLSECTMNTFWNFVDSLKQSSPKEDAGSPCCFKSECKSKIPFFEKHSQQKGTNGQESRINNRTQPDTESSTERCNKQVERPKNRKISKRLFGENEKSLLQERGNIQNDIEMNSHPFDTALAQLDEIFLSKRENNSDRKPTSPPRSEIKNVLTKSDINEGVSAAPELTADSFGTDTIPVRVKLSQIKINFNQSSHCKENISNLSCNKKSSAKENVNIYMDNTDRSFESKNTTPPSEKIPSKRKSDKTSETEGKHLFDASLKSSDSKTVNEKESSQRKRPYQSVKHDLLEKRKYTSISNVEEMYAKKRRKVERKFRKYFGEILTVSEDEEEKRTLRNKFRKRRKKDSVDSCDSGVFLTEENVAFRSNMEVLKEIETVMPDSTMREDNEDAVDDASTIVNNEGDKIVEEIDSGILPATEDVVIKSATSTCEADSSKNEVQEVTLIEIADSCSQDSFLERVKTSDTSEANEDTTKTQVVTTSIAETEVIDVEVTWVSGKTVCNVEDNEQTILNTIVRDTDVVCKEDDKDTKDNGDSKEELLELLSMNITETCKVIRDGNVISLQENNTVDKNQNIINTNTDETNSSLNEAKKDDLKSSHNTNDEERVESREVRHITPKDEQNTENILSESLIVIENTQKVIDVITLDNDISNILNEDHEKPTENAEVASAIEENKDQQPNAVPHPRLRVLSSAELGSRWCPTPIRSTSNDTTGTATISYIPTTVNAFNAEPFAFTVNVTLTSNVASKSTTAPISTSTFPVQTVPSVVSTAQQQSIPAKSVTEITADINKDYSSIVDKVLIKIWRLVKHNRFLFSKCSAEAVLSKEDRDMYKKSTVVILALIEQLGMILDTTSYDDIVNCVIKVLNKKLLTTEPLSFQEMAAYAPVYQSIYYTKPRNVASNNNVLYSTPNGHTNAPFTHVSNSQQIYRTPVSQPIPATNNLIRPNTQANVFPAPAAGNQMPTNAPPVHVNVRFPSSNHPNEKYQRKKQTSFQKDHHKQKTSTKCPNNSDKQGMGYRLQKPQTASSKETLYVHSAPNQVQTQNIPSPQSIIKQLLQSTPVLQQSVQNVTCPPVTNIAPNVYVQQGLYTQQTHKFPRNYTSKSIPNQPIPQAIHTPYANALHNTSLPVQNQQAQLVTHQQAVPEISQELNAVQLQSSPPLLQNVQQGVPVILVSHNISQPTPINYIPQAVHFSSNLPQCVPANVPQKENIPRPVSFTIPPQTLAPGATTSPQYILQSTHSTNKPQNILPVQKQGISLQVPVDAAKTEQQRFHILKYVTATQKRTLISQILQYFTLTKSLQRYFTIQQWNNIQATKLSLYHLQTVLSSCVQKTMGQYESPKAYETVPKKNISVSINNVPEIVEKTVPQQEVLKETVVQKQPSDIPNIQEEKSIPVHEQQCDIPLQENSEVTLIEPKTIEDVSHNLESTETLKQTQDISIEQKEETEQNKQIEETSNDSCVPDNVTTAEVQQASLQHLQISSESLSIPQEKEETLLSDKETENVSSVIETTSSQAADLEKQDEITAEQQTNFHLVTVEVSPNNYEVKVVDADIIAENTDNIIDNVDESKTEECNQEVLNDQLQHSIVSSPLSIEVPDAEVSTVVTENFDHSVETSDPNLDDSIQETTISFITDVRSIPLNVFEEMGNNDNADTDKMDTDVEEEENKICLNCNKTSTVLCEVCLDAHYCSKTCSESHWEEHYKNCKPHHLYTEYKCDFPSLQHVLHPSLSSS